LTAEDGDVDEDALVLEDRDPGGAHRRPIEFDGSPA